MIKQGCRLSLKEKGTGLSVYAATNLEERTSAAKADRV
jgi:hypothetical protein